MNKISPIKADQITSDWFIPRMPDIDIVTARAGEPVQAQLEALFTETTFDAFKPLGAEFARKASEPYIARRFFNEALNNNEFLILAGTDTNGDVVSFAAARDMGQGVFDLVAVGVRPDLRGHGIGTHMMVELYDILESRNADRLNISSPTAARFFARQDPVTLNETALRNYRFQQVAAMGSTLPGLAVRHYSKKLYPTGGTVPS